MKMKSWDVCPECGARRIAVCRFCNTIGDRFPLADLDLVLPPEHAESVSEGYNTKDDLYDDGDGEIAVATKTFIASSLGAAFGGGGASILSEDISETRLKNEQNKNQDEAKQHSCQKHGGNECCHGDAGTHGDGECKCTQTQNSPDVEATGHSQARRRHHDFVTLSHPLDLDPEVAEDAEEYPLAVMCPCCDELLYPQFLNRCQKCGFDFPDGVELDSLGDTVFYRPNEGKYDNDAGDEPDNCKDCGDYGGYDDYGDYDDFDNNEEDEEAISSDGKGRPAPAGCCLMILGIITAGLMWFY